MFVESEIICFKNQDLSRYHKTCSTLLVSWNCAFYFPYYVKIEFHKTGVSQGSAYQNLVGPVFPAASTTCFGAVVQLDVLCEERCMEKFVLYFCTIKIFRTGVTDTQRFGRTQFLSFNNLFSILMENLLFNWLFLT